ncbi:hypothetical protein [Yersinia aldovae]|uniref:hypothetical protein n=1 Tax=Yersinia aldovae TaxID=29483 RepID=UPI000A4625AF|nr:hypothetical protein [Yersinia aldovae]
MSEKLDFGGKPRIRLTADGLSNVMTGMITWLTAVSRKSISAILCVRPVRPCRCAYA